MIKKLKIFPKKERHIILEELDSPYVHFDDSLFRLTVVSVDEDNNISIEKERFFNDLKSFLDSGVFGDRLVLALSSRKAKTIEASFSIERYKPHTPINEGELDHLMFKVLWEFLNKYRKWAFNNLGVADVDMVLAGIEVSEARIDGHSIVHPLGLKGRELSVKLRGTFVPRNVLPTIERVSVAGKDSVVLERLGAVSSFVDEGDVVVHVEGDHTLIFSRAEEIKFIKSHSWGINSVVEELSQLFSVSHSEALQIFYLFCSGKMSTGMEKVVNNKSKRHLGSLSSLLKETRKEADFVKINIPNFIYDYSLKKIDKVENIDFVKTLEDRGFHVNINNTNGKNNFSVNMHPESLALAGISLFMPRYEIMNSNLHRRAKWLMAK